MAEYRPIQIAAFKDGMIKNTQDFLLPNDGYVNLENAYIWRDRIKRKQGTEFLGRLRRVLATQSISNSLASPWSLNLFTEFSITTLNDNGSIEPGSVVITIQAGPAIVFTDQGDGTLTSPTGGNSGTINYATGDVILTHTAGAGVATTATISYFPSYPVMGLRTRELSTINVEQTIAFDQKFAYRFVSPNWEELPTTTPTTWDGSNSDFFWTTNYWVDGSNNKLFWATNGLNTSGNDLRYYNGTTWTAFTANLDAGASQKVYY